MSQYNNVSATYRMIFPFLGMVVLCIFLLVKNFRVSSSEDLYLNQLDLHLEGVITYVETGAGFNGFGIIGAQVITSNKFFIDDRKHKKYLYCLLKSDKVELYQILSTDACTIGDTILVNTAKKLFSVKNGSKSITFPIKLCRNESYWRFVQNRFQKF